MDQSLDSAIENFLCRRIRARQPEIEHAPERPHESVQDVRRRIDEILFDPQILRFIFKEYATFGNGPGQGDKRLLGRALILFVVGMMWE